MDIEIIREKLNKITIEIEKIQKEFDIVIETVRNHHMKTLKYLEEGLNNERDRQIKSLFVKSFENTEETESDYSDYSFDSDSDVQEENN